MQIHENYIIKQVLGHGASCTVRKAIRKDTGQVFAIKIYQNQMLKAKNQIDMLIRLDHPSIVNIYEIIEEENTIILVLQYMEGGQLYAQVGQKTKFTEAQVREYMKIIIDAIRYCHQMNIVHRDIKPQNLLLTSSQPDGILKLADFGISKILSDEMLTTNCGTPVYMAPQIWKGVQYNQKVDMWSAGVVMYYLLSGTHPFDGDNQDLGKDIMNSELTFPDDIWRPISSKAINLIRLLLNKDPIERPDAKDIQGHIWLSHVQPIPKQVSEPQQVNLYKTIHKVKRFIYKDRLKRTNKKMKDLMDADKLSKTRIHFLAYDSEELYSESQPTEIQIESNMEEDYIEDIVGEAQ